MATLIRGYGHAAVTQSATNPATPAAKAVAITDGEGNLLRLVGGALAVTSGSGPNTSLAAATATGPGVVTDLGVVRTAHALDTTITGSPSAVTVNLEGSLDGTAWVVLATSTATAGDVQTVSGKGVRYVRANLVALTGGTAPTVTALIASAA